MAEPSLSGATIVILIFPFTPIYTSVSITL